MIFLVHNLEAIAYSNSTHGLVDQTLPDGSPSRSRSCRRSRPGVDELTHPHGDRPHPAHDGRGRHSRPDTLEWCRRIDAGPFSTLALGERVAYPNQELFVTMAAAAVLTERVRIMSTVVVLPDAPGGRGRQAGRHHRRAVRRPARARSGRRRVATRTTAPSRRRSIVATSASTTRSRSMRTGVEPASRPSPTWRRSGRRRCRPAARRCTRGRSGPRPSPGRRAGPRASAASRSTRSARTTAARSTASSRRGPTPAEPSARGTSAASGTPPGDDGPERLHAYAAALPGHLRRRRRAGRWPTSARPWSADRVREAIDRFEQAGCDELLLVPTGSDPDEVDRLVELIAGRLSWARYRRRGCGPARAGWSPWMLWPAPSTTTTCGVGPAAQQLGDVVVVDDRGAGRPAPAVSGAAPRRHGVPQVGEVGRRRPRRRRSPEPVVAPRPACRRGARVALCRMPRRSDDARAGRVEVHRALEDLVEARRTRRGPSTKSMIAAALSLVDARA